MANDWETKNALPIGSSYGKQLIGRWHKSRRILMLCSLCCVMLAMK